MSTQELEIETLKLWLAKVIKAANMLALYAEKNTWTFGAAQDVEDIEKQVRIKYGEKVS